MSSDKITIKIVVIGHLPLSLKNALNSICNKKSILFDIYKKIDSFMLTPHEADLLDWGYSDKCLNGALPDKEKEDLLLAIVNVPLEDNYYVRRLGGNRIVFTFYEIKDIMQAYNLPLENVILRVLYAYSILFKERSGVIPNYGEYTFTHDDARGCIFDMNGIKSDVVISCDKPIICEECKGRIRKARVSNEVILQCTKELKNIKKTFYYRILDFIKKNPISSFLISSLYAILLGIVGSIIASFIK